MKKLYWAKTVILLILISLLTVSCGSYAARSASRKASKQMAGSGRAFRESRKIRMAKKQQEKRQAKIKKDYYNSISDSRKRTYEIQSPDVKERMKRNEANISAREKAKDKRTKTDSKNRARRYR
ncbi:MAG TPA: hypothetical protein VK207_04215 [Bacteroidales bacterium]|jgi:hypothetical protein|nr:hypothetical protein [Bacteroidales bacterium]